MGKIHHPVLLSEEHYQELKAYQAKMERKNPGSRYPLAGIVSLILDGFFADQKKGAR